MIDPNVPAPLPSAIVPEMVKLVDGSTQAVVTVEDAAKLSGYTLRTIDGWIAEGKLTICYTPDRERRVFVQSLWMALPIELRR